MVKDCLGIFPEAATCIALREYDPEIVPLSTGATAAWLKP